MCFFRYGGEDISKTVASICMIFSGKMNYTNMHMTWGFVLHFSQKGYLHFCPSNLLKIWVFLINFTEKQRLGVLVNAHVTLCLLV